MYITKCTRKCIHDELLHSSSQVLTVYAIHDHVEIVLLHLVTLHPN